MRLVDAEALRVGDADRLQPREHVLVLDAFGDQRKAERLADAQDRLQLVARRIARQDLAADAAVDLDELHPELLHRRERHRAMAEAVDQQGAADGAVASLKRLQAPSLSSASLSSISNSSLSAVTCCELSCAATKRGKSSSSSAWPERFTVKRGMRDLPASRLMVCRTTQRSSCAIMR